MEGRIVRAEDNSGMAIMSDIKVDSFSSEDFQVKMISIHISFIILVTISTLYSFITAFDLNVEHFELIIWICLSSIIWYYLGKDKGKRSFLLVMALFIINVVLRIVKIEQSIRYVMSAYVQGYDEYFATEYQFNMNFADGYQTGVTATSLMICMAAIITMIMAYIITHNLSKYIYIITTIPFFVGCFWVGKLPNKLYFFLYVCVTVAIFGAKVISGNYLIQKFSNNSTKKQKHFKNIAYINVGITFFIIVFLYVTIFNIVYSEDNFKKSLEDVNAQEIVDATVGDIENLIHLLFTGEKSSQFTEEDKEKSLFRIFGEDSSIFSEGGMSKGKLSKKASTVKSNKKTSIIVKIDRTLDEDIYLKGRVTSEYIEEKEDYGWSINKKNIKPIKNDFDSKARFLSKELQQVLLKVVKKNEKEAKGIVPYNAENSYEISKDGLIGAKEDDLNVNINTFENINFEILKKVYQRNKNEFIKNINEDQKFVDSNGEIYDWNYKNENTDYAKDVPLKLYASIEKKMKELGIEKNCIPTGKSHNYSTETMDNIISVVEKVQQDFFKNYKYVLNVDEIPDGEEPIDYFLNNSKKGWCMHYATAATAMFRYAGLPTRYVDGYIVKQSDFNDAKVDDNKRYSIDVKGDNAHAWVEIYLDDIGWIPIEVTFAPKEDDKKNSNSVVSSNDNNVSKKTNQKNKDSLEKNKVLLKEKNNDTNKSIVDICITIFIVIVIIVIIGYIFIKFRKYNIKKMRQKVNVSSNELIKYVIDTTNKIFNKKNIFYKGHNNCKKYANEISKNYDLKEEDILKYLRVILKDSFDKEGISNKEYDIVKNFYNDLIDYYYKNLDECQKWYFDNIGSILRSI